MLRTAITAAGFCAILAIASPLLLAQPPEQEQELARLVEQLNADEYAAREEASQRLADLGAEAVPALEAARRHPSEEVRFRAAAILERQKVEPLLRLHRDLAAYAALPDGQLDVEQGMFLLSRILDPQVKKEDLTRQLDEIAAKVRERLGKDVDPAKTDPQKAVDALRQVLFTDCGFGGNNEDYGNPENCSLARILETKKGRPIFVCHLMIAVARRLEIPIVGLPVSGQYIVKYDGSKAPAGFPRDDIFLHPYDKGKILSRDDRGRDYPEYDPDRMIPPGTNRDVLERMINNVASTLASRQQPGDPQRRELVAEFQGMFSRTTVEDLTPDILPAALPVMLPARVFRMRAIREPLPIGDY